jgi:hypothetical protein
MRLDGFSDGFVARLSPTGRWLTYGTFLGGNYDDSGSAIALNGRDDIQVTGATSSDDFPTTPDAFDTSYNGENDVFAVKLAVGYLATPSQYLPLVVCCAQ